VAPAIVSVTRINKHPAAFRKILDGVLQPLMPTSNFNVQRQDGEQIFAVNGAIYAIETDVFLEKLTFHVEGNIPYELSPLCAIDIDTIEDLKIAEVLGSVFFAQDESRLADSS